MTEDERANLGLESQEAEQERRDLNTISCVLTTIANIHELHTGDGLALFEIARSDSPVGPIAREILIRFDMLESFMIARNGKAVPA